jgi:hypothetical protein
MTQASFKLMFVESMNVNISMYMGEATDRYDTVDEVFQLAERAIKAMQRKIQTVPTQSLSVNSMRDMYNNLSMNNYEDENVVAVNALMTRDRYRQTTGASRAPINPNAQPSTQAYDAREQKCFHCGQTGHMAWMCALLRAKQPQSVKGAKVYADFCQSRGRFEPYDMKDYAPRGTQTAAAENIPTASVSQTVTGRTSVRGRGGRMRGRAGRAATSSISTDNAYAPLSAQQVTVDDDDDEVSERGDHSPTPSDE